MDRILVIGANRYNFTDEGRTIAGVNCHYVETYEVNDPNRRGLVPMKSPLTDEAFAALTSAPCLADVEFGRRPGKGGKPETFIRGLKVIKPLDLLKAGA